MTDLDQHPASLTAARPWKALGYYNLYRQVLALLMVTLTSLASDPRVFGDSNPELFTYTSVGYLVLAALSQILISSRRPTFTSQVILHLAVDIAALTLLMHASGGIGSGLGMLLTITVAAGGLLLVGDLAVLFAAVASLALLGEQVFAQLHSIGVPSYTQAGILGAMLFTTALTAQWAARRLKASEALAEQRGVDLANLAQLNDYVIHRLQSGVTVIDPGGQVRLMNQAARTMFGLGEADALAPISAISPKLTEYLDSWRKNPAAEIPTLHTADDATEVICRFARLGSDGGALVFLDDSSTHEHQLQQMKQATLGRLAGSIAHEIRNPLSAIHHASQLLGEGATDPDATSRLVKIISQHVKRVDGIISNILELSRHTTSIPDSISLQEWVTGFIEDFCATEEFPRNRISCDIDPDSVLIEFDKGQLQQVISNLCRNVLRYGLNPDRPYDILISGGLRPGVRGVFLEVTDHGPGISADEARHIFEPFYTTSSRGSGLGLYIARALCEHNFARLDYLPQHDGSTFRIRFAELPSA